MVNRANLSSSVTNISAVVTYCVIFAAACGLIFAQNIPIINDPGTTPGKAVEVERVEVGRRIAMPNAINRPNGPFELIVVNRTGDPNAAFVLLSTSNGAHVLVLDAHTPEVRHQRAGYLDLAPGKYALEDAARARVLCTITIE